MCAASLTLASLAAAQQTGPSQARQGTASRAVDPALKNPDNKFVIDAGKQNMAIVRISAWAKDHAVSPDVRSFASKALDNRTLLGDKLRELAANRNLSFDHDLDPKDSTEEKRLEGLESGEFDRQYMHDVMNLQRKELGLYQKEASSSGDPNVKSWAAGMVSSLQGEMQMAEAAHKSLKDAEEDVKALIEQQKASPANQPKTEKQL